MQIDTSIDAPERSERQEAVLDVALGLLVEGGEKALTTAGLARAANCSKESLYKWFGDRDGLLSAMIAYQASKVRGVEVEAGRMTADRLKAQLVTFAQDLLGVLSGEVSLALNRLAIGQASREGSKLGRLLEDQGRRQVRRRAIALMEAGRRAALLRFETSEIAYESFYGLVVSDLHLRMLLGEDAGPMTTEFSRRAGRAVDAFLQLYGTGRDTAAA